MYNPGKGGIEIADEVTPLALDWIRRNARRDDWFLHVNYWDPHTPYRTPESFGNPFANEPLPGWLTETVRQQRWDGFGPHSAREPHGWSDETSSQRFPRVPARLDSMEAVKRWIDGYDVGIRYADEHAGRLLNALADAGVLEDTVIMVSSDHGENQGELNVWGDHQTADQITCRVPLIVCGPGIPGLPRVDRALHYQYDWAATLVDWLGGSVPDNWDGRSFAEAFRQGSEQGRPYLIVSQNAWSCQRSVRFDDYICLRTYHDGYKELEPVMLFDLGTDPHEQHDLASDQPDRVNQAMAMLSEWYHEMAVTATHDQDPLMTVLREGGPFHTRGMLSPYLQRLRDTGRAHHAARLAEGHPGEI
jgi:choline-sulfatase